MKVFERKIQSISGSLLVSLPKTWADSFSLKKGSILRFAINPQGIMVVSPEIVKPEDKKETVIEYDERFVRKFFREYLAGYQKIIIKFHSKAKKEDKRLIYGFLKKFMNVQIIEESEDRIVLKCFRIEELSIEECLNRMFYLTLSMAEEWKSGNDKHKMKEMELTVKRFYYMLVMQIRRFIGEGKYADRNQIGLVRAMDCRLVGANIERISEFILKADSIKDKDIKSLSEEFIEFYKKAFSFFINNNYQKSLDVWGEEKKLEEKYGFVFDRVKKSKDVIGYDQANNIFYMVKLSKQISMLIR